MLGFQSVEEDQYDFSRMRSEGFPFMVGVWGWTCFRVVLVVSSSLGRRRVVVLSLSRRYFPAMREIERVRFLWWLVKLEVESVEL